MQQELLSNIKPFNPQVREQTIAFLMEKQESYFPYFKNYVLVLFYNKLPSLGLFKLQTLNNDVRRVKAYAIGLKIYLSIYRWSVSQYKYVTEKMIIKLN